MPHALKTRNLLPLLLVAVLTADAMAAERFYRYRDDQGVLVLDYQVPPHLVKNGYEVVSPSGQVLEVVPPHRELTEEARKAAERAAQQELEDQILLKSYSSIDDLYNARDRKLEGLKREIDIISANIAESTSLLDAVRAKAANLQLSGRPVQKQMMDQIDGLIEEIGDGKQMLALRQREYQEMEDRYSRYADRLKNLFGIESPAQTNPPSGSATAPARSPSAGG